MAKKLTTAEWIEKAKAVHGDRYDYSAVVYESAKKSVLASCKEHGAWDCQPSNHVRLARGCPECGGSKKKTTEDFVLAARRVHGEKYDYSLCEYTNSHTNLSIMCPVHGVFQQSPTAHLSGQGCRSCGNTERLGRNFDNSLETVKERIADSSCGLVSLIEGSFSNINSEAEFVCRKHGRFNRLVNTALYSGRPCLLCWHESDEYRASVTAPIYTQELAEQKIAELLDPQITYEPFVYDGAKNTQIRLNCPTHGVWIKTFQSLLRMRGRCPECAKNEAISKRTESIRKVNQANLSERFQSYKEKFLDAHGDKYDYSNALFNSGKSPIEIVCPVHGAFTQTPDMHIRSGCRQCADEDLAGLYSERFFELKPNLKDSDALVYCLELTWEQGRCFKFGITRNSLRVRFGMALAKGIEVKILGVCKTTLYQAWKYEVRLLEMARAFPYEVADKKFARDARISPSELCSRLPEGWNSSIPWSSLEPEIIERYPKS